MFECLCIQKTLRPQVTDTTGCTGFEPVTNGLTVHCATTAPTTQKKTQYHQSTKHFIEGFAFDFYYPFMTASTFHFPYR